MTLTALPINASAGSPAYTAQQFRQAISALIQNDSTRPVGSRSGYTPGHAPTVLTVTSTTWTVGPFSCIIDPAFTTTQGPYLVSSDANTTGSVTAAPSAPNSRVDLLYAQVNDTDIDSSGLRSVTVSYLAGTSANPGVAPSLPARSFLLATINVPSSPGTLTITQNPTYTAAAGGVVVCTSSTHPSNPYVGMPIYETDTSRALICTNTTGPVWSVDYEDTGWVQPTLGNSWVSFDGGSTYDIPAYRRINGVVYCKGLMKLGTTGTTVFTFPSGFRPAKQRIFSVASANASAVMTLPATGAISVTTYATGGSNGDVSLEQIIFPAEL